MVIKYININIDGNSNTLHTHADFHWGISAYVNSDLNFTMALWGYG